MIGTSGGPAGNLGEVTWSHPFEGLVDEVVIYDSVMDPQALRSMGTLQ